MRARKPSKETKISNYATAARPNSKFRMGVEVHRLHAQWVAKTIHGHKTCQRGLGLNYRSWIWIPWSLGAGLDEILLACIGCIAYQMLPTC